MNKIGLLVFALLVVLGMSLCSVASAADCACGDGCACAGVSSIGAAGSYGSGRVRGAVVAPFRAVRRVFQAKPVRSLLKRGRGCSSCG